MKIYQFGHKRCRHRCRAPPGHGVDKRSQDPRNDLFPRQVFYPMSIISYGVQMSLNPGRRSKLIFTN